MQLCALQVLNTSHHIFMRCEKWLMPGEGFITIVLLLRGGFAGSDMKWGRFRLAMRYNSCRCIFVIARTTVVTEEVSMLIRALLRLWLSQLGNRAEVCGEPEDVV